MIDQSILQQNIIAALDIQNLPDDRKLGLIDKMAQLVEKRLLARLMENLSESDAKEFDKLGENNEEARTKFLQAKFPNFAEMMQEEIIRVKQEVAAAGQIQ